MEKERLSSETVLSPLDVDSVVRSGAAASSHTVTFLRPLDLDSAIRSELAAPSHIPQEIEKASKLLSDNLIYVEQNEEHKIDISEDFLKSVHDQVTDIRTVNRECRIFRVPPEIRSINPMAYTPKVVCIGPYFYSKKLDANLRQMQEYKWTCVRKLMSEDNSHRSLQILLTKMKGLEKEIQDSYSDKNVMGSDDELAKMGSDDELAKAKMRSDELAKMMLIDGCFILHVLLEYSKGNEEDAEQVIGRCWIWKLVIYDLLLLENQIPFFVIVELFKLLKKNDDPEILVDCGLKLFSGMYPPCRAKSYIDISSSEVHHLLHLFYRSILPTQPKDATPSEESTQPKDATPSEASTQQKNATPHWIPSARELQDAGVKFEKSKNDGSFLEIQFEKGVMRIPTLEVHDYSNSLFRNLIAFEQCYPGTYYHITIYVSFMDFLLKTPEDARLLHLSEILINRMATNQDTPHFFSQLCDQVHYAKDDSYLKDLCEHVNKYRRIKLHKWMADFARKHIGDPWLIIGLVAAIFLLLLTFGQTFYTIYPYYHK